MLLIRYLNPMNNGKEGSYDTFFAGLIGGYAVFGRGRQGSVNKQVQIHEPRWPHITSPSSASISQTD
jgi:peroxisomal membrane protein 4